MTKRYDLMTPEQIEASRKQKHEYYLCNRDRMLQQSKDAQRRRPRAEIRARNEKWQKANWDRYVARFTQYRIENRGKINEQTRIWQAKNRRALGIPFRGEYKKKGGD